MPEVFEQLGDFLRSRREKLKPEELGLPRTARRRTPGLRREEVADLAGISAEWYVKLEQGRAVTPSHHTIDALARALRLGRTEHAHLRALARSTRRLRFVREEVPLLVQRMLDSITQPAYVAGQRWDILAWNAAAIALFPGFDRLVVEDRNVFLYILTDPRARLLFGERWPDEARRMISLFRSTHDLWAGDPAFVELIGRVRQACSEFDGWWTAHDIGADVSGKTLLQQPDGRRQCFDFITFQANDDRRLKLVVYFQSEPIV